MASLDDMVTVGNSVNKNISQLILAINNFATLYNSIITVANGGTGNSSLTANSVLTGNGTNPIVAEANFVCTDSGDVGIGTASPSNKLTVTGNANITGNVGIGTASPSSNLSVQSGTSITNIGITNSSGSSEWQQNGNDLFISNYNASGAAILRTNSIERMRITSSGSVLVTNAAGLGYGTGSGGTVTQVTNKSTAVTLNKPTGQITMNNAALTANTTVGFTVNNSIVATTDVIILTLAGGGTISNYLTWAQAGQSGAFTIYLRNISAGSLSDAITINFAVIKSVTA